LADILDEVEQDYRAERARRLFLRYGAILGALLLLVVAGVAGWQAWRWSQLRAATTTASAYLAAGNADPAAQASAYATLAATAPAGYAALARLRAAGLAAAAGEETEARALWEALARDPAAPALYRDLATVLWAMASIGTPEATTIEGRLAPLADGPWRAAVAETRALAALAAGDNAAAARGFAAIAADPATPSGIRIRAERLRGEGG